MQKVLISGSAGFIGGYVVEELLAKGYAVVGVDNFSKYGKVTKSYDDNPNYRLVEGDCQDVELMTDLLKDCDHFIAGAAMIGGISYFHIGRARVGEVLRPLAAHAEKLPVDCPDDVRERDLVRGPG